MNIDGRHYRTIWPDGEAVCVIDQTRLPFAFEVRRLATMEDAAEAISTMIVRGAPLIGATAAYGVALAMRAGASDALLDEAVRVLGATRPTAVNLHWALERMARTLRPLRAGERAARAFAAAAAICDEDVACCRSIGEHGAALIGQVAALTAYELGAHGVPHTVVADNAGGHLMQHGRVDLCIVGSDRTTATGDV